MLFIALFAVMAQVFYCAHLFFSFLRLNRTDQARAEQERDPLRLSVIIPARNEASNLKRNIPLWLKQIGSEPIAELVVVNDRSSDQTDEVIRSFSGVEAFKSVSVTDEMHGPIGKKRALLAGVSQASAAWLFFTDADCYPARGFNFLSVESAVPNPKLSQKPMVILGSSLLMPVGSLVSELAAFDSLRTNTFFLAAASTGQSYMAVGRSLLFQREAYAMLKGYSGLEATAGGDDDLALLKLREKVQVLASPAMATLSNAPSTLWEWMRQRQRHLASGLHYPPLLSLRIAAVDAAGAAWALGVLCALTFPLLLFISALLILVRFLLLLALLGFWRRVSQPSLGVFKVFYLDLLHSLAYPLISMASLAMPSNEWRQTTR